MSMAIRSLRMRDEDEDEVLRDSGGMRVPMLAMDGVDQKALARSAEAHRAYDERITAAWRNPKATMEEKQPTPQAKGDALADAQARYEHWLTNAWRCP